MNITLLIERYGKWKIMTQKLPDMRSYSVISNMWWSVMLVIVQCVTNQEQLLIFSKDLSILNSLTNKIQFVARLIFKEFIH